MHWGGTTLKNISAQARELLLCLGFRFNTTSAYPEGNSHWSLWAGCAKWSGHHVNCAFGDLPTSRQVSGNDSLKLALLLDGQGLNYSKPNRIVTIWDWVEEWAKWWKLQYMSKFGGGTLDVVTEHWRKFPWIKQSTFILPTQSESELVFRNQSQSVP